MTELHCANESFMTISIHSTNTFAQCMHCFALVLPARMNAHKVAAHPELGAVESSKRLLEKMEKEQ